MFEGANSQLKMAMNNDDNVERFMVRRYSEIVRGDLQEEHLSQGLAVKVDLDAEREGKGKYYMGQGISGMFGMLGNDPQNYDKLSNTNLIELGDKSKELELTWRKFTEKLKLPDDSNLASNSKPDINVARVAIESAQAQIQKNQDSKIGKVKAFFSKSAQVLDDYNYLFDLLPTGDKYTSVFTGALTAIVKATATHDKIAREMSDAFDEISDQVRSFYFVLKNHSRSAYISYHISLFYFELFGFLICVMREWYQSSWKRLSRSLGNTFLENTVRGTLQTLSKYTKRVETEHTRWQQYILGANLQNFFINYAKDHEQSRQTDQKITALVETVTAIQAKFESVGSMLPPPLPTERNMVQYPIPGEESNLSLDPVPTWSRDTILSDVEHLKPYLQTTGDIDKLTKLSRSIAVNIEISIRIHKWVTNPSSEVLWIEGPAGLPYPSQNTLTSAAILANVQRIGIPVMLDFIQYNPRSSSDPEKELLKVIYALIYQAARARPESTKPHLTDLNFLTARFTMLTEEVKALPEALKLLADLLIIGPPLLFCIIDGLQSFHGRHLSLLVRNSIRELVGLLCKAVQDTKGNDQVIKVLFTTGGFVRELADLAGKKLLIRESFEDEDDEEILTIRKFELTKK